MTTICPVRFKAEEVHVPTLIKMAQIPRSGDAYTRTWMDSTATLGMRDLRTTTILTTTEALFL